MSETLIYVIAGVLGVLFITISRMISLKTDAEKANQVFVYSKYFKSDGLSIALSFLSVIVWLVLFPETATKYPALADFVRWSFFASGALGAWALQKALGSTKKWIRGVVDIKTNVADRKITAEEGLTALKGGG